MRAPFGGRFDLAVVGLALLLGCGGDDTTSAPVVAPTAPSTTSSSSTTTSTTVAPAVTTSTLDAGATDSPLTPRSRFHVRGVGPVHAGMTVREAEQAAGAPLEITGFEAFDGFCYYATPDGLAGLSFMVGPAGAEPPADPRDGVIVRAEARGAPWETVSGIRVGSTEAEVNEAYEGNIETEPHVYQPGGHYLTLTGTGTDAPFGIRFETTRDLVVENIFSGDARAITAIEGCA